MEKEFEPRPYGPDDPLHPWRVGASNETNEGNPQPGPELDNGLKFPDKELFNKSPEAWFRKHRPDWDDEAVERAVEIIRIGELVEQYESLKNDPTTPKKELDRLEKEIERRRRKLGFS